MKTIKIQGEYIVKQDLINILKKIINDIDDSDIIELDSEYESNFGTKIGVNIETVEFPNLRIELKSNE